MIYNALACQSDYHRTEISRVNLNRWVKISGVLIVLVATSFILTYPITSNTYIIASTNDLNDPLTHNASIYTPLHQTPMADAQNAIKRASEYYGVPAELFIGIANAESSFRNFKNYNPWGLGNGGPKSFTSWEQAADEVGYTLKYYYLDKGLDTPEKIMRKYVGWDNPSWVKNVKIYFK